MPRIRQDNDARYALRASFVDENGDILATPIVIPGGVSGITATQIANWDTAYSWGDHALAGYYVNSTSNTVSVSKVLFANNEASAVTSDGHMAFDLNDTEAPATLGTYGGSAPSGWYFYSGGNTGRFWTDEHFGGGNVSNWETAYGWGDHASAGYISNLNAYYIIDRSLGGQWRFQSNGQIQSSSGTAQALEVFADNTNDAFMTFHVGSDYATNLGLDGGTNRIGYGGWSAGSTFYKLYSTQDYPDVLQAVTGQYGSIEVDTGATNGYEGYSIGGRVVFMHDNNTFSGIFNDVNNHWIIRGNHNAETSIYHAGVQKGYTYASGWRVTGTVLATGDVYAYYSDRRLKAIEGPVEGALEKISALHGVYYTHNAKARELGYEGSERQVGLIAQEVEAVLPEVIGRAPIDDDGEGGSVTGEDYITVNYQRIVPLLVEGIKELTAELESVKLELKELRDAS